MQKRAAKKCAAALTNIKRAYLTNLEGFFKEAFDTLMRRRRKVKDNVYRVEGY